MKATIAVTSSTEPPELRASVWRMPLNGATKTWLTFAAMPETRALAGAGVEQQQDDPQPDQSWIRPNTRNSNDVSNSISDPPQVLMVVRTINGPSTCLFPTNRHRGSLGDDSVRLGNRTRC